ncbi:hypothetical protein QQ045_024706 [Rhodiola kirilowii]
MTETQAHKSAEAFHVDSSRAIVPGEEEINDCPIEEVRLTVPITDDPTTPVLTFRTWVLGLMTCIILAFINKFFGYRNNSLSLTQVSAQIVVLPIGKFMAATLPTTKYKFFKWTFTLNPGPFTMKEHVCITIFATSGANGVYAVYIVSIVKALYHKKLHWMAGLLLSLTTQLLGYGWAGLFRKYLVDNAYMWWPYNLISVSLFRALHEKEKRPKGGLTRIQFFFIVATASFVYYIVPGYFFPLISYISVACFIWKKSVTAQQIGSGYYGLGVGSFGLDWSTISYLGTPLANPGFTMINILIGFVLTVYVLTPIIYWTNLYDAKKFPIISYKTFDSTGAEYNISRILDDRTFSINDAAYDGYSKLYMSVFFAFTYGISFATLTAAISHVGLFHGKEIWDIWRKSKSDKSHGDVHTRIMKRNYKEVPQWWFHTILVVVFCLALFACEGFGKQLQLPWWGLVMACGVAFLFTLPIGIIAATTNQYIGLNVITELIIGYILPGKPLANVTFKTYGYISMVQAQAFLQDFKLGAYMKIPPVSMFIAQLVGTVVSVFVHFGTAWWMLTSIDNICDLDKLPASSPWTCPSDNVFYNASIIWGVIGPARMFTKKGVYPGLNWFFLIGFLAPVPIYILSRIYPEKKWIPLLNMPIIIGGASSMPQARSANYIMWIAVGMFFNIYVYRKHKAWWVRNNYVLSAALDAGLAFMGVALYFTLGLYDISGPEWWGLRNNDFCTLAKCPTAPGVVVKGCPVF